MSCKAPTPLPKGLVKPPPPPTPPPKRIISEDITFSFLKKKKINRCPHCGKDLNL